MRMRHEDVHFEKRKFLTNSGRKQSAPSQRDPPAKIVLAKFLRQKDSKRLYVVSLHCWRCIVGENQKSIANEVFCHRFCYANYTHPEKLQRIPRRHCPCHRLCWLNLSSCCARHLRRCTIQTCWQRKSRTPFSLAVKWRSLRACENGTDSNEQKIRNDLLKIL